MKEHLKDKIFTIISEAADELQQECYVIGGYVRDIFLKRPSKDIDVVVVGSGIDLAQLVSEKLGKRAKLTVFKTYGTAQVKLNELEVEFVGARRESYQHDSRNPIVEDGTLEDDQNRRDFTMNALAICLNKDRFGELVDPFGGLADLQNFVIRTPLNPDITFSDDPLRMMRGIRFSAQLGFFLETGTFDAITRNKDRIEIISKERIANELNKIKIIKQKIPFKYFEGLNNEESSGNYMYNCRDVAHSFDLKNSEDCKYIYTCDNGNNSYDLSYMGVAGGQRSYNIISSPEMYGSMCCFHCSNATNIAYCIKCV